MLILVEKIVKKVVEVGVYVLDVLVFGGDLGVKNGILIIMVGGD